MNLAFVISSLAQGGAEGVLARMATGLAARGHGVRVLTLDAGPAAQPLGPGVAHRPLGLARASAGAVQALGNNLGLILGLRRALLTGEVPDAVLSFITETSIATLLAVGTRLPVAAAERVHPAHHPLPQPWRALRPLAFRLAARIAVQTPDVPAFFPPALRARCAVIPNPAALPRDGAPEAGIASALAGDAPLLLALGRLERQKGFDLLLAAFAPLAARFPQWRLAILGEGSQRPALEAQIRALGLTGRALLPGRTAAPGWAMRRASIFALPSRYEGFPNVLAEALACGLPCAALDCPGGPHAILRPGVDGLLAPAGDVSALRDILARLMADADLRARLGARGPEVLERYAPEAVLDAWEALFRAMLAERRAT